MRPEAENARFAPIGLCCDKGTTRDVKYAYCGEMRVELKMLSKDVHCLRASLSEQDLLHVTGASGRASRVSCGIRQVQQEMMNLASYEQYPVPKSVLFHEALVQSQGLHPPGRRLATAWHLLGHP